MILRGVLELQVLDQAVRIELGEAPPKRCPYVERGGIPFLQPMGDVAIRYKLQTTKMAAPHLHNRHVWIRSGCSGRSP